MKDYLETMGNYSPSSSDQENLEEKIIEEDIIPNITALTTEDTPIEEISYMAPKGIKVRRYTLKK